MSTRIAAIGVSHWHSLYDAAYLRHLAGMPDVQLVALRDTLDHWRRGTPPPIGVQDCYRTACLIDQAYDLAGR